MVLFLWRIDVWPELESVWRVSVQLDVSVIGRGS